MVIAEKENEVCSFGHQTNLPAFGAVRKEVLFVLRFNDGGIQFFEVLRIFIFEFFFKVELRRFALASAIIGSSPIARKVSATSSIS